jgi:hypothetical protein
VLAAAEGWATRIPGPLALELTSRAVDKPERSVDDALELLDGIPERRPGQILPPFVVQCQVPYRMTAEMLRDLWADDQVEPDTVRLRELVATQDWLAKDDLRRILKGDANWSPETLNVEGSPNDLPYVIEWQGLTYIYDGHHRLAARLLLAVAKTRVYYLKDPPQ